MSFFTRALVGAALVAGVVHVFRKDLQKVAKVLQKPAENFVKEVKKEIDATTAQKLTGSLPASGGEGAAAEAAERARVAAAAAQEVNQKAASKPTAAAGGDAATGASGDQQPPLR